jgi:hypothetical protein
MKHILIYLIAGIGCFSACNKKHLSYKNGIIEEPMYKKDRKVEAFRQNSGISSASNNHAEGSGTGYSYASYGSRQEVLNAMGKQEAQRKADSLHQVSNMNTYTISDTLSENINK